MIGSRIAHYEVLDELGAGGMGVVYRARDTRLDREVAIKALPQELVQLPEWMARFEREARVLASLSHPNIAAIHGLEKVDHRQFLVLELVEGQSLAERLLRGPVPVGECLELALQIAEGVEAAHGKGVIHRDLKPSNVMLTPEGRVKVLDFGLAKVLELDRPATGRSDTTTLDKPITHTGIILGTPAYMSPEQARGERLDARTDIWSFGAILYEMLAGRRAFLGNTSTDVLAAILEREIEWGELPDTTPWRIRELLRRCLRKEARRRLHAIADARIEIQETLGGESLEEAPWKTSPLVETSLPVRFTLAKKLDPGLDLPLVDAEKTSIDFSSDGRRIAFVTKGEDGVRRIHIRALDDERVRELPGTEGATTPFFSPDGEWLGFFQRWKMKRVPVSGGTPLTLGFEGEFGASWGEDDTIVFPPIDVSGLTRVSVRRKAYEEVTVPDRKAGELSHRWPQFLPGGKAVLFTVGYSGNWDEATVAIASVESGERRIVLEGGTHARYSPTGHIVYAQGGTLWAVPFELSGLEVGGPPRPLIEGVMQSGSTGIAHFALSGRGSLVYAPGTLHTPILRLVWVDREGRIEPLPAPPRRYYHPRLSPDGSSIAVGIDDVPPHIWLYDIEQQSLSRLTFESYNRMAIWTPDGARVTWGSPRGGPPNIFWRAADGSGAAEQITRSQELVQVPLSWSPDGRVLLFASGPGRPGDIWVVDLGEDGEPRPLVHTSAHETNATFSPDGRWFVYQSDESGRYEIYVQPFPGPGGKRQLSTNGGESPVWSRGGNEIFFRSGERMMSAEVSLEPRLDLGRPRELFRGTFSRGLATVRGYDVSADGRRFLMAQHVESEPAAGPLTVVLNWPELLD